MILQQVKSYIRERGEATLGDIALHFDSDAETLKPMLDFLERKGRIRAETSAPRCASACHCKAREGLVTYKWNPAFGNISIQVERSDS